jgi:hypothetical protein
MVLLIKKGTHLMHTLVSICVTASCHVYTDHSMQLQTLQSSLPSLFLQRGQVTLAASMTTFGSVAWPISGTPATAA